MKKQITLALALTLALLSGCGNTVSGGSSAAPSASIHAFGAGGTGSDLVEALHFKLGSTEHEESLSSDDGTKLAHYSYSIPALRVESESGQVVDLAKSQSEKQMLDIVTAFNSNFTKWVESAEFPQLLIWAKEDYNGRKATGAPWEQPYEEEFTYDAWQTNRLISISGHCYSYTGGAHPSTLSLGWNFDLQTGRFIHPPALGADSEEFQKVVTQEIIRQADARAAENKMSPTELYWEDYQEIAAQWPDYAVTFQEEAMTITFSAYEMGSYASGPQVFNIEYDFLKPYLSSEGKLMLGLESTDQ